VYLSHTRLKDRYTIRLAIGNLRTELQHVAKAWKELQRAAQAAAPIPLRARRS
jgi:aromatic-L-amino-acid decarboxylase